MSSSSHPLQEISPSDLHKLKSSGSSSFLLLDIREEEEFSESRLAWPECLHVPPGEISPSRLHVNISLRLNMMSPYSPDRIVLMDHNSKSLHENVYLQRLSQQLRYHSLLFSVGGYLAFSELFPEEVTHSSSSSSSRDELNTSFIVSPAPPLLSSPAFHSGAISLGGRASEDEDSVNSESSLSVFNAGMIEEQEEEMYGNDVRVIMSIKDRLRREVAKKIVDGMKQ